MSELPSPVSESTAIEVVRMEGSTRSDFCVEGLTAGDIVYAANGSGLVKNIGTIISTKTWGVALYTAVSGARAVTIKGKVRARWDGAGTVNKGTPITNGAYSGWFTAATENQFASGITLGYSHATLAATSSGQLCVVTIL